MKKNNKGFTLVELLAVIVILAIILAIAIPAVGGITTKAKQDSYASNVKMIIKSLDLYNLSNSSSTICASATSGTPCTLSAANVTAIGLSIADYGASGDGASAIIVNGNSPTTLSSVVPSSTSKFKSCSISGTASSTSVTVSGC